METLTTGSGMNGEKSLEEAASLNPWVRRPQSGAVARGIGGGRGQALVALGKCVVVGATLFSVQGCAAAFRDSKATVYVSSDPEGATLEMAGTTLGTTSGEAKVPRQGPSVVNVKKEGYEQGQFALSRGISGGWLVWDALTCVIPVMLCIPLIVDGVTGAWMNVDDQYAVTLTQQQAGKALPAEPRAPAPPREVQPVSATQSAQAASPEASGAAEAQSDAGLTQ